MSEPRAAVAAPERRVRAVALRLLWVVPGLLAVLALAGVTAHALPGPLGLALAVAAALGLPGWAAAGVLRLDGVLGPVSALALAPVLGLLVWAPPSLLGFAVGLGFPVVCGLVAAATAGMLAVRPFPARPAWGDLAAMAGLAAVGGFLAWRWQSILIGDGLFHAGVIRKLLVLDGLSFRSVWQFRDGHPHAGYAFPLLHVAQAAAIRLAGPDPSAGYPELATAFGMLAPLPAYAVGRAAAGRTGGLVTGALVVWIGITGDQAFSVIQQPRYVVTFLVLPAVLLLLLAGVQGSTRATDGVLAGAVFVVAILHSTYVPPLLAMLLGLAVLARPLRRPALVSTGVAALTLAIVYAVAVHGGQRGRQPLVVGHPFLIAGSRVIGLTGSRVLDHRFEFLVALGALVIVLARPRTPVAVLAVATGIAFLIPAVPGVLGVASAVVGRGQAARYWEVIPWPYLLGPALVLLARGRWRWPIAAATLAASLAVSRTDLLTRDWLTALTALAAAGVLALLARLAVRERGRWMIPAAAVAAPPAAALALAAAVVAGPLHEGWDPIRVAVREGRPQPALVDRLTPGAVAFMRRHDGALPVVLAPFRARRADFFSGIAYELVGEAAVYTVAVTFVHTASEPKDHAQARREDALRFYDPRTPRRVRDRILARYGVSYVAIRLRPWTTPLERALRGDPALQRVYADPRGVDPSFARLAFYRVRPGRLPVSG